MTAQDIAQEINCKLGYYYQLLENKPDLLENLVIIIPSEKYDILSDMAVEYFWMNDCINMKFDRFMGVPLKIAENLDKIYVALNLEYEDKPAIAAG